ncbi:MAG: ABC-type transport auxiliary lipoprotein family protein, partial [Alphaproteobacteria bacterium]|nr:ABC-type transport auxiliary lipoprotein family protein [Alphaproteobacteria bacterium]
MKYFYILTAIALTSCSLLPEPEGLPDRFLLEGLPPLSGASRAKSFATKSSIIIDQPMVYAPLDNSRIAIKPTEHTIDYIADVEWGDRLSTLIHESMIQSFQNAALFESVGRLNSGLQSKYMLSVDVRKFNKRCCDQKADVEYFIQIFDTSERRVLASRVF